MELKDPPYTENMVVLDPSAHIITLGARYLKLRKILNEDNRWASFLEVLPYNDCNELEIKARAAEHLANTSPGEVLLWWLSTKKVTVQMLKDWLKEMKLEKALIVLEDNVQLRIISQPPDDVLLREGEELLLTVEAVPEPEYQWFKHDVDHDCIELEEQNKSTLRIPSIQLKDAGIYVCRVHTNYMDETSSCVFSRYSRVQVVPSGFKSLPSQPYVYTPQQQLSSQIPVDNVGAMQNVGNPQNLQISNRWYGSNSAVKTVEPTRSNNMQDLKIIKHPVSPGRVNQGSTVILECKAQSFLPVHYQWYCNGMKMPGEISPELKLSNLYLDTYPGEYYHCEAYTEVEHLYSRSASFQLNGFDDSTQYFASDKVALLIANTKYDELDDLGTPPNDVAELSRQLKSIGFRVIALMNLNLLEMKKAVYVFCESLRKGSYGLVYYAGHGFEQFGQSYFQPVDASEYSVPQECVCVEEVLQNMQEKEPALSVLLIDMCRRLPKQFRDGKTITPGKIYEPVMKRNVVYGYATSFLYAAYEGKKFTHGYFMKHLKEHITKRECILDVLQAVKCDIENDPAVRKLQYPWIGSSLTARRKLTDPIIDEIPAVIADGVTWEELQSSPFRNIGIRFPCLSASILLEFHPHKEEFCNVTDVYLYVEPENEETCENICQYDFNFTFNLDIPHNPIEAGDTSNEPRICCGIIEIFDLHKIQDDFTGMLQISHRKTGKEVAKFETLPFLQPPISKLRCAGFWHRLCNATNDDCNHSLIMDFMSPEMCHMQNHHKARCEDEDLITFSEEITSTSD